MADNELFWPSLYSRLVPHRYGVEEPDEAQTEPQHFLTDFQSLRHHIETDLVTLLNATCLEAVLMAGKEPPVEDRGDHYVMARDRLPLSGFPRVRRSIVNYGLPSMIGRAIYRLRRQDLETELREAILAYEPRLNPETLRVRVSIDEGKTLPDPEKPIGFDIQAEVLGTPRKVQVEINTIWDLEKLDSDAKLAG